MRVTVFRLTMSRDGWTSMTRPGALWMMYPSQFSPASVPPVCAPFIMTTRSYGLPVESVSMISLR